MVVILAGTGYWYQEAFSLCRVPVHYSIGTIDDRFDLTRDEVRSAVSDAESLWEDVTERNLFTYDPDADFTVNFIFDDRQELTNKELELSELLDEKKGLSEHIRAEYDRLVAEYEKVEAAYDSRLAAYENRLGTFNGEVAHWNNQPRVPQDVYNRLNKEQQELDEERAALNALAADINTLVAEINSVGDEGNAAVEDYNEDVSDYNDQFNHSREFTQGDYQGDSINIYTFEDGLELRTVLAHELGHALNLDHVDDPQSIMYYLMEGQHEELALSFADFEEFKLVCGTGDRAGFLGFLDVL